MGDLHIWNIISLFLLFLKINANPWEGEFRPTRQKNPVDLRRRIYSSNEIRKTQFEHVNIVCQNLNSQQL